MKNIFLYLFLAFTLSAGATTADTTDNHCPACKNNEHVIPIVYGKPTRATVEKGDKELVKLAGCRVAADSPAWYCKRDKLSFGLRRKLTL